MLELPISGSIPLSNEALRTCACYRRRKYPTRKALLHTFTSLVQRRIDE